jgi:dienelactone hydrolase
VKSGANPDNIVVIGYCFGGTAFLKQLEVTRQFLFMAVLAKINQDLMTITAKVLVCHGADDFESAEVIAFQQEMRSRLANDLLCRCSTWFIKPE